MTLEILDCTLRDGGYYTDWDFDSEIVNIYLSAANDLPIDYLEVGYRNFKANSYKGKYFYSPLQELIRIRNVSNKKIVVILNEKDIKKKDIRDLMISCVGVIDMVRLAISPDRISNGMILAEELKKLGFKVCFNVMYMSKWNEIGSFSKDVGDLDGLADYFYMVDSYGGVFPEDVKKAIELIREKSSVPIGFHGHNNLELALVNTLTAIENGVTIVDSTVLGMGRGAGNLKTELLLNVLHSRMGFDVDFNALGSIVSAFQNLHDRYNWGTNLPYMISGISSLPQKEVMEWITTRFFSLDTIVRALDNQKCGKDDNLKVDVFKPLQEFDVVLIIGGGQTPIKNTESILRFIGLQKSIALIHASSKNANLFSNAEVSQYFCLVGNEGHRLERVLEEFNLDNLTGILPPYPRRMGTYIPDRFSKNCRELESVDFSLDIKDTHTALALQTALNIKAKTLYFVGYDGYYGENLNLHERILVNENEKLFDEFKLYSGSRLISLFPSMYSTLEVDSIFSYIYE
jgi:4-hydroxy 2-oxovalerate aldolase